MHSDLEPAEGELAEVRARLRRLIDRRTICGWVGAEQELYEELCGREAEILYATRAKRAAKCRNARGSSTMR